MQWRQGTTKKIMTLIEVEVVIPEILLRCQKSGEASALDPDGMQASSVGDEQYEISHPPMTLSKPTTQATRNGIGQRGRLEFVSCIGVETPNVQSSGTRDQMT